MFGQFSGHFLPALGPKKTKLVLTNGMRLFSDKFWCATIGSRRIYYLGHFFGHFGPDSVPIEGHGWVHSNVLLVTKNVQKMKGSQGRQGLVFISFE